MASSFSLCTFNGLRRNRFHGVGYPCHHRRNGGGRTQRILEHINEYTGRPHCVVAAFFIAKEAAHHRCQEDETGEVIRR
jgi:hypothetical protein